MSKSRLAAALIAALVLSTKGEAHVESQAGGALLGGAIVAAASAFGGAIVGSALWSGSPSGEYPDFSGLAAALAGATVGAAVGYPCGCAAGTATVGRWQDRDGNPGLAYAGSYAGMALGALAGLSAGTLELGLLVTAVLAPAGAVIGYNIHGRGEEPVFAEGAHVNPPTVAFNFRTGVDRRARPAFDCRLVTVKF